MNDLRTWLDEVGLGEHADLLAENDIELDVLPHLTESDLRELGLSLGHRKKLLAAVSARLDLQMPTGAGLPSRSSGEAADGERRQLTVMFCDLVGSTELAQAMDPELLHEPMRRYQDAVAAAIVRYGGFVAKFLGDGVLAYFGWPQAYEDQAERSVRAALEAVKAVEEVPIDASNPLLARVGIATGNVVVGDLVGEVATELGAVLGDTPNLAARLQSFAEPGTVIVDDTTRGLIGHGYELEALGGQTLRGFSLPVDAWRVNGLRSVDSRFDAFRGDELSGFVGREEEIATLADRWARAKSGQTQAVAIAGEAGIGKSRLLREFRARSLDEQSLVLVFQCSPYQVNAAFYPIIQRLQSAADFSAADSDDDKLDKLDRYFECTTSSVAEDLALIAGLLSLPTERYPALNMTPPRQKLRTIEFLLAHIVRLSARRPVALLVEDIHWIDPSSLELFEALVNAMQTDTALLVMTHRPDFDLDWPGSDHLTRLSLDRLGRGDCAAIVARVVGGRQLPEPLFEQVLSHTDGIPLFVEELTRTVLEVGLLEERDGRLVVGEASPTITIPSTLHGSLMARLDRLGKVRGIIQAAACIGREFSADLLATLLAMDRSQMHDALTKMLDSGLVFRRRTADRTVYVFKHALVQDAAYDSLLAARKRAMHARLAAILGAHTDEDPLLVAQHCAAAGLAEEAAVNYLKSGRHALSASALPEAIGALELGLKQSDSLSPSGSRDRLELDLRLALGTARMAQFGWPHESVAHALQPAYRLALDLGDRSALGPIFWGLWVHYQTRTEFAVALDWLDRLEEVLGDRNDPELSAVWDMSAGCQHFWLAEYDKAGRCTDHIRTTYDGRQHAAIVRYANHDPLCFSLHWAGTFREWIIGYPDRARGSMEDAVSLARRLEHPFNTAFALTAGSHTLILSGDTGRMLDHCREVEAIAESEDLGPFTSNVLVAQWRGMGLILGGRFQEGYESIKTGNDFFNQAGGRICNALFLSWIAQGLGGLGRFAEALEVIDRAIAHCRLTGDRYMEPEVLRLRARLLDQGGGAARDEIESTLRESIDVARVHQAKSWELRAATDLAGQLDRRGRPAEARQCLAPVYEWFTEGFESPDLVEAIGLLGKLD
jgi:class 3 adenylate cyclase